MKIRKMMSMLTAAAILASAAGCGKKNDKEESGLGKPAPRGELVYETEGKTKYESVNYSFEISNDFTLESSEEYIYEYKFSSSYIDSLSVKGGNYRSLRAHASILSTYDSYNGDSYFSDLRCEMIDNPNYEVAAIHYTRPEEFGGLRVSEYELTCQTQLFELSAKYAPENEERVLPVLDDIVASVVRTSDYVLPTEPQDFDCEYFSIHYDSKWDLFRENISEEHVEATLNYAETDDPDKYLFPNLSVSVSFPDDGSTAREKSYSQYQRNLESSALKNTNRGQQEILGFDSFYVENELGDDGDVLVMRNYYFDHNGVLYNVKFTVNKGSKSDEQDIEELLEGITIK